MLFNSYIFIFFYMPIALLAFYRLSKRKTPMLQMLWLAIWSCFFYAYWKPKYLILLMFSVLVNYRIARKLMENKTKSIFAFGIVFNILIIVYFKYLGFLTENFNALMSTGIKVHHIALPLGISFITFQKIAYLCDVYRGRVTETSFMRFLVFISFFPQLIAGPIVHYSQLMPQFSHTKTKKLRFDHLSKGISLFVIGLFKKVILADIVATYADPAFSTAMASVHLTFFESWIGLIAYTLQIYFDFSGYSDMAIGLAFMFGIKLPLNFNSPYKSTSIIEFWRRWHMTLSAFLRDYIYIPLGGNQYGSIRKFINLFVTMLVGGLWHGANWTFVLWGAMHGGMLTINHLWRNVFPEYKGLSRTNTIINFMNHTLTLLCVSVAWMFFRMPSFGGVKFMLPGLLGLNGFSINENSYLYHIVNRLTDISYTYGLDVKNPLLLPGSYLFLLMFIVIVMPNSQEIMRYKSKKKGYGFRLLHWKPRLVYLLGTVTMLYSCLIIMSDFNFKPFAYFAF